MNRELFERVKRFDTDARKLFARNETSVERVITLSSSYSTLGGLSLKQDELFRQSLRCVESELYRAAHVLGWAGFIDFLEEKLASDRFAKLHGAYPKWSSHKTPEELREHVAEFQLIEAARKLGLVSKTEMKALHGLLNKRNECAHPSDYYPSLNESLGYLSELIQRIGRLKPKTL